MLLTSHGDRDMRKEILCSDVIKLFIFLLVVFFSLFVKLIKKFLHDVSLPH